MKTALVIFNGIQFPYYVVDRAIEWGVKNDGDLLGIFIHSDQEPPEGYIFPSDIDPAENLYDKDDAEKSNVKVIHSQMILFRDLAKGKGISARAEEFVNPSPGDILEITRTADILFIDVAYDKAFLLACTSINLKDIIKQPGCPVEIVHDKTN